jgi:hypothetical protein
MAKTPTTPAAYPGISEGGKSRQVAFNTLSPKKPKAAPVPTPPKPRGQRGR